MKNRFIAFLLVVLTLFGGLILPATAAEDKQQEAAIKQALQNGDTTYNDVESKLKQELNKGWTELYAQTEKYQLFCNKYTGEVYLRDLTTGQFLTTNPIKVGTTQQEDKLSQVWLSYKTFDSTSTEVEYNSFKMAAERGQISVSPIRNGIRVEYLLGDTSSRSIAPQAILDSDFRRDILTPYVNAILSVLQYNNFLKNFSAIVNSVEETVEVIDPETGEPVLDPETGEKVYEKTGEWVIDLPENANADTKKDVQNAQAVYQELKVFDDEELGQDIGTFQKTLKDVMGKATAVSLPKEGKKPDYAKINASVCARFRWDYLNAYTQVTAGLQSDDPAVKEAAESKKKEILKEIKILLPDYDDDQLPTANVIGPALVAVFEDYGNLDAHYNKTVVDLNKSVDELKSLQEQKATATGKDLKSIESKITDVEKKISDIKKKYPVLDYELAEGETYPLIRTLDYSDVSYSDGATIKFFRTVQNYLSKVNKDYTLTMMIAQEETVGADVLIFDNPLFRCALEYLIDDTGVTVDIPASSIIFDESKYELTGLSFLRYFGAGWTQDEGYIFYPDGSGALIYNQSMPQSAVLNQPVYSYDYALSSLRINNVGDSVSSSQAIRMPVFGAVNKTGNKQVGYLAVITEGDSLAHLIAKKLDNKGDYLGVYATYSYRLTDKYAISGVSDSTVSIWSDFKYTGKYTQKYVMLTDQSLNPEDQPDYGYRSDYVGMAAAYRDYLFGKDVEGLSEAELKERIPFYVETYATVKTIESVLSFPVSVNKPLTSFKDVQTIGDELRGAGIKNIKFRLIGYYNKGYRGTYPTRIKWMKEIGGKKGFASLMEYVEEHKDDGFDVFTDVDLLYNYRARSLTISRKKTSVRSMNDRYVRKVVYSTITRATTSNMGLLISASKLSGLFAKFDKKFQKFKSTSIALANLASDLSSNFNDDDFYTREQAKGMIADVFKTASDNYTVMTTGGNVYTLPYVDYLLSAPVDGSHYNAVSRTVPFFGMVMHGIMQYAGSVFNEAGDPDYELLRDIESGAGLYVVLVCQNTDLMKEDSELIKHYSSNYQIWKEDLISYYDLLDYAIGDLQSWKISDHRFLIAERQAQKSEREEDLKLLEEEFLQKLEDKYSAEVDKRNTMLRQLWYIGLCDGSFTDTKSAKYTAAKTFATQMEKGNYGEAAEARLKAVYKDIKPSGTPSEIQKVQAVSRLLDPNDEFFAYNAVPGQKYNVIIDVDAIVQKAEDLFNVTVSKEKDKNGEYVDDFYKQILAFKDKYSCEYDVVVEDLEVTISGPDAYSTAYSFVTDSAADDAAYVKTDYTMDDGSVVLVTYSNGEQSVRFLLNFSIFPVNVRYEGQLYSLDKYDFVRLDERADGTADPRIPKGE